jgi:hypothetical protein
VHDERVIGRPLLCNEDLRYLGGIERVRAEAIHRLGRKGDDPAVLDDGRGRRDLGSDVLAGIDRENAGLRMRAP